MNIRLIPSGRMRLRNGRIALVTPSSAEEPPPTGGGNVTLTLVDIDKDRRLFQRDALGGYDLPVSGTTSSNSAVQARAVDAYTGAVVVDWTTIGTPSGGNFTGTLRCPARVSPCLLQVRDSVDTASTKAGTNRFFVGAIWVWCGQSNAVNMPTTPSGYPISDKGSIEFIGGAYKRVGTYSTTEAYAANTLFSTYGSNATITSDDSGRRGDGYVYLANVLSARLGCAVCLIDSSSGGQPIAFWDDGATGWTNLTNSLTAAGGKAEGIIFYQGEQSSVENTPYATYLGKLQSFQARLLTFLNLDSSTFKFGVVSLGAVDSTSTYANNISGIRAAQVYFANNTPGAFLAAANHDNRTTDAVHTRGVSYAHLGPVLGHSAAFAKLGTGLNGAGPRVVGATRSGAVITLTVQHSGGTALVDGGGGTGTALTGFRVTDGGAAATIASTAITGPTTITLTLSAVPTGAVTVDYAMIAAPHAPDLINPRVDPTYASAVYDNVALVNQTRGCILQPFAAITVTGS